jgi:sigma-B regulation protein RsbU (phosphoserine phosphatase)
MSESEGRTLVNYLASGGGVARTLAQALPAERYELKRLTSAREACAVLATRDLPGRRLLLVDYARLARNRPLASLIARDRRDVFVLVPFGRRREASARLGLPRTRLVWTPADADDFRELLGVEGAREPSGLGGAFGAERLLEELERARATITRRDLELSALYRVGHAIKTTFVLEELSRMIVQVVTSVLAAHRGSILLIDDENGDLLVKGAIGFQEDTSENIRLKERGGVTRHILSVGEPVLSADLEADLKIPRAVGRGYRTGSFMAAPVKVNGAIRAIINVSDQETGRPFSREDLRLLALLADQVSVSLENFELSQRLVERERVERELQIAHRIQMKVLPHEFPQHPGVGVWARSHPAKEIGGDYYDFFTLSETRVAFAIGDVSGKGIPAALVMMMLRSLLKVQAQYTAEPDRLLAALNALLARDLETDMFITFFYGVLDVEAGGLRFANAGHPPPLVLRAGTGELEELPTDGTPLGMFDQIASRSRWAEIGPGDTIVLYTDGVVDAVGPDGEPYGEDRFRRILDARRALAPPQLSEAIYQDVMHFLDGRPLADDLTLVVVRRTAGD